MVWPLSQQYSTVTLFMMPTTLGVGDKNWDFLLLLSIILDSHCTPGSQGRDLLSAPAPHPTVVLDPHATQGLVPVPQPQGDGFLPAP